MYTIPINNLRDDELADVVDSMPYKSGWASGLADCCVDGVDASAGVSVGPTGVQVQAGGGVSKWWLIGGAALVGYFAFFHKK